MRNNYCIQQQTENNLQRQMKRPLQINQNEKRIRHEFYTVILLCENRIVEIITYYH